MLARAWVAAAEGALSQALVHARQAADLAADAGQPAYEVLALQTAVGFGDRGAARLATLATKVDGPRAGVAARFAAALEAGDGAELAAVSEEFERMGDLVAAVDAAARPSRIVAGNCADRRWAARREPRRWPHSVVPVHPRFIRPASGYR